MSERAPINPWPQRAADAVGGQSELARRLTVERGRELTPQAVGRWCRLGRIEPFAVIHVERVSGVPRHKLAPELYPDEQAA